MAARNNRRRDSSGHIDPYFQRRARFEAALRPPGLWEMFARLPREMQNGFLPSKFPDPILEFDQTFPDDDAHRALRKMLETGLREAFITMKGGRLAVRDFFTVIAGLFCTIRDSLNQPGLPEECRRFMREAGPVINACYEQGLPLIWDSLHRALIVPLLPHGALDTRLLNTAASCELTQYGKSQVRFIVSSTEPQTRRVELDGSHRPMYRVGTSNEWNDVKWLSWNRGHLDRLGSDREYPVYIQSHALRHLRERVNLPKMAPYLESWLHESLKTPQIVEKQGPDLLVEYRIHEDRIGYLVVTPMEELIAVRTFLFLTMQGTPEARKLKERLRLTRRDVDWLGLHELAAFTQTDLRSDPVLRPLMEECGCGHLFELSEEGAGDFAPKPKAFAAEMRRYLRMAA